MAELTIRVERSEDTGKLVIRVGFTSDEDALPQEHEEQHRRLVRQLLPLGCEEDPESRVVVTRERPDREPVVG
jgi:hypothetical protein